MEQLVAAEGDLIFSELRATELHPTWPDARTAALAPGTWLPANTSKRKDCPPVKRPAPLGEKIFS